jgi:TPP-dependent trihydroxycyclohexane-1,2-dione (THcHDO) dehydratase
MPATGISFGLERLVTVMEELGMHAQTNSLTQVLVTQFSDELLEDGVRLAARLRQSGFNTELYPAPDKLKKQLSYAAARGIPVVETTAGKGGLTHDNPVHAGPVGIIGSTSANALAAQADVIIAIGTRLQDFTTGSWTAFAQDARFISINTARFDAIKHQSLAVVGDALETVTELDAALGDWRAPAELMAQAKALFAEWNALLDKLQAPTPTAVPTYAQ